MKSGSENRKPIRDEYTNAQSLFCRLIMAQPTELRIDLIRATTQTDRKA